jgi:hypothetical protein
MIHGEGKGEVQIIADVILGGGMKIASFYPMFNIGYIGDNNSSILLRYEGGLLSCANRSIVT